MLLLLERKEETFHLLGIDLHSIGAALQIPIYPLQWNGKGRKTVQAKRSCSKVVTELLGIGDVSSSTYHSK